jgi:hypothetical protein
LAYATEENDQLAAAALCFLPCFFFFPLWAFLPSLLALGAAAGAAAGADAGAAVGAAAGEAIWAEAFNEKERTLVLSKRARSLFIGVMYLKREIELCIFALNCKEFKVYKNPVLLCWY